MTIHPQKHISERNQPTELEITHSKIPVVGAIISPYSSDDPARIELFHNLLQSKYLQISNLFIDSGVVLPISNLSPFKDLIDKGFVLPFNSISSICSYLTITPFVSTKFGVSYYELGNSQITFQIGLEEFIPWLDKHGSLVRFVRNDNPRIILFNNQPEPKFSEEDYEIIGNIIQRVGSVKSSILRRNLCLNYSDKIFILNPTTPIFGHKVHPTIPIVVNKYDQQTYTYDHKRATSVRNRCFRNEGYRYDHKAKVYTISSNNKVKHNKPLTIYGAYNHIYSLTRLILDQIAKSIYSEKWWKESIYEIEKDALSYEVEKVNIQIFAYDRVIEEKYLNVDEVYLIKTQLFIEETNRRDRFLAIRHLKKLINRTSDYSLRIPNRNLFRVFYTNYGARKLHPLSFLLWWVNKCHSENAILPLDYRRFIKDVQSYYKQKAKKAHDRYHAKKQKSVSA